MILAPVIVFAFNRPDTLQNTLSSLRRNELAKDTDLFVFVDGPRNDSDAGKIAKVRNVLDGLDGFKSITIEYAEVNKGLARSVIEGTTKVINNYGKVIVVEDDLYVSESFLRFMNQMLDLYEHDARVMQISGYGCLLNKKKYPYDVYLNERAHSWTWATWSDRWRTVDWAVKDFDLLKADRKMQRAFCKRGSDLYGMLKNYMEGKNNSWYIRFDYAMFKQRRYAVCPIRSLVRNDGFTSEATHCNVYNRDKVDFEECHDGDFNAPEYLHPDERIMREAVKFWTLRYRVYGKIRTLLMKLGRF